MSEATAATESPGKSIRWESRITRILFRIAFLYWILWGVPWLLQQFARLTQTPGMGARYWALWNSITRWAGTHLLGFDEPAIYTDLGSGDSPFFWTLVVVQLGLATLGAVIWMSLSPARTNRHLTSGLNVGLRILFALVLIEYGAAKVIRTQFPTPRLDVLATPFGELPPERLLWAFMGVSPLYNIFTGLIEMAAGALLLFRRSSVVGAMLGIGAITQVLFINLAYDVPVKLFCMHLILVGIWLFAPYAPQALRALIPPSAAYTPARHRYAAAVSLVVLLIAGGLSLKYNVQGRRTYGDLAPKPPLYGMYRVTDLESNGADISSAWQYALLIIPAHRGPAQVRLPDGRMLRYRLEVDTLSHKVVLQSPNVSRQANSRSRPDTLTYLQTDSGLEVEGRIRERHISAQLARVRADTLPLLRQRLRWVR